MKVKVKVYSMTKKKCEHWKLDLNLPIGPGVGGGLLLGLPNVVKAVELTPNKIMKTANNMVKLPHCVKRLRGCIFKDLFIYIFILQILCSYILLRD